MRKIVRITITLIIAALIIAGLTITGCQQRGSIRELSDAEIKAAAKKQDKHMDNYSDGMWAESKLPPEQAKKMKKEIEAGFKKALEVWLRVSDSPDGFAEGMAGAALQELKKQSTDELAQGKIKIRVHDNREFEVVKVKEESGAIAYAYTDNGYYIDAKTKQKISKPLNEKKEWLIGIAKIGKTWKISEITPLRPKGDHEE